VKLVRVRSGVVAASSKCGDGNVRTQWWAYFESREQFLACCADDPLRFTDPVNFRQLQTEFDHVFDRSS
jgi:predicted transcriptional regulator